MPNTPKKLYRGSASTSSSAIYTVPASTTTVVTSIVVTNSASYSETFSLYFDGVLAASAVSIGGNSLASFDVKQVLNSTESINILGSSTNIKFHISGVEIV